jgi:nicotinamide phosphoribosyltransferase
MKATYGETTKGSREIFKDPKTDSGTKKSAKGLLHVSEDLVLTDQCTAEQETGGALQVVFKDGQGFNTTTLEEIRTRLGN